MIIGLQNSYYSVREDGGLLQVCVEVLSGDINGRTISLNYTTIDGSAEGCLVLRVKRIFTLTLYTAPSDYIVTEGSLSISEDDSVQCVSIAIVNDSQDEQAQECFLFVTDTPLLEDTQSTIKMTMVFFSYDSGTYIMFYICSN